MTEVLPAGDPAAVERAVAVLLAGGLVALPTETVYGLGARADDAGAVDRVFRAKGRPATDPLICHVADVGAARGLAATWPAVADRLAHRWWPGPLTLVVPRAGHVLPAVAAGGPTVAVRVPAHPVALDLLRRAGVPVAAPSANRFGRVSPTTAAHVVAELDGRVDVVLDGGPTPLGIESTVVAVGDDAVDVLRPGGVTVEDLRDSVGAGVAVRAPERRTVAGDVAAASPGQLLGHYAPATPVVLAEAGGADAAGLAGALADALTAAGRPATVLHLPAAGWAAAPLLYARLRDADLGADAGAVLVAPTVDPVGVGRAVNDRLFRAAHGRVATDASPDTVARLLDALV